MADGIKLAEFLSDKNRLLPERTNLLYNELVENYHLYYSIETSAFIFVYPRNTTNEILAKYLTKRIIENAESLKIALTCEENNSIEALQNMFQFAGKILEKTDFKEKKNIKESIIFSPLNANVKCGYLKAINKLEEYFYKKFSRFKDVDSNLFSNLYPNVEHFTIQETIEFNVIEPILTMKLVYGINDLCEIDQVFSHPLRVLVWNYVKSNLVEFSHQFGFLEINETVKCLDLEISTKKDVLSNDLKFNMSTLTGVFNFFTFLQLNNDRLSFLHDKESFATLCNNHGQKLKIVDKFCHIRYMLSEVDTNFWSNYLRRFAKNYLEKKIVWFVKLRLLYDNKYGLNGSEIKKEFRKVNEEIAKVGENDEKLLRDAFFIVRNNTLNAEHNVTCSPFRNNKFYKIQVRGKLLRFSDIFGRNHCRGEIKFIELFALEKIIVDQDLMKVGEEIQLNIIAPIWEIVFDRVINLDGISGNDSVSDCC